MAGVIKRKVRDYIDQGNDVTNGREFYAALSHGQLISGLSAYVCTLNRVQRDRKLPSIPKISSLYEFLYSSDTIRAWQFLHIGKGKKIDADIVNGAENLSTLEETDSLDVDFWTRYGCTDTNPRVPCTSIAEDEVDFTAEADSEIVPEPKTFDCPVDGCIATFSKYGNLLRHIDMGRHSFVPERVTLRDAALNTFKNSIEDIELDRVLPVVADAMKTLTTSTTETANTIEKGWALKQRAAVTRFSANVQAFLRDCFEQGLSTGKKMEPRWVARKIKTEVINRAKRFLPTEYLDARQIGSAFHRLAASHRRLKTQLEENITEKL
jgi:hypothetical protein